MSRAAIRYAKAILDLSVANNNATAVNADMQHIVAAVKESHELALFLNNPVFKGDIKLNAVNEVFANVQNETKGLFQILFANKRFEILKPVAVEFSKLFNEISGVEVAQVTTAVAITSDIEQKVLAKAKEFSSKNITIQNIVDPSIIGGFILRIGDKQFNASVSNKLQQLKREFSN